MDLPRDPDLDELARLDVRVDPDRALTILCVDAEGTSAYSEPEILARAMAAARRLHEDRESL